SVIDDEADDHRPGIGIYKLDVLDLEIDVTIVPVEFAELFLVVLELLILKIAAAGNPGEHPMAPSFNNFAQFALGKCFGADELDLHNLYLRPVINLECRSD